MNKLIIPWFVYKFEDYFWCSKDGAVNPPILLVKEAGWQSI
jgi:hypothetical protein